jgi:hypothetical protein
MTVHTQYTSFNMYLMLLYILYMTLVDDVLHINTNVITFFIVSTIDFPRRYSFQREAKYTSVESLNPMKFQSLCRRYLLRQVMSEEGVQYWKQKH